MVRLVLATTALNADLLTLLKRLNASCVVDPVGDDLMEMSGQRIFLPWHVVRALMIADDLRPRTVVQQLGRHGRVLVGDDGLTIVDALS